jgi:putative MATE family efflux protein
MSHMTAPRSPSRQPLKHRYESLLAGPVVPAILKLALPTVVVLAVQTSVGVIETYFVSNLGTDALAGVTLVFPVLMLMQMMANGGIGGGTASAISRALGAGRHDDANAIVWHTVIVAIAFGALFTIAVLVFGSSLYRLMGGEGDALQSSLTYSSVIFSGAIPIWIVALLSSALRGAGNSKTPAFIILLGMVILIPLSPVLIFGWGPFPELGVAGAGVAVVVYHIFAAMALALRLRTGLDAVTLKPTRLQGRLFRDILGVGFLSAVGTVQVNLTIVFLTASVSTFGMDALAGYGIASRLDYIQIPVLFGLGTAIVTLVGLSIGAGNQKRARQVAWTGAMLAVCFSSLVGACASVWPANWITLFSASPDVVEHGSLYLRIVAPFYPCVAVGMALYFASQGANQVLLPVLAGSVRMLIAAVIGWAAVHVGQANLSTLYIIIALSMIVYAGLSGASMFWGRLHTNEHC